MNIRKKKLDLEITCATANYQERVITYSEQYHKQLILSLVKLWLNFRLTDGLNRSRITTKKKIATILQTQKITYQLRNWQPKSAGEKFSTKPQLIL